MAVLKRLTKSQQAQIKAEQKRISNLSNEDLLEEVLNNSPTPPHEPTMAELEQMRRLRERKSNG